MHVVQKQTESHELTSFRQIHWSCGIKKRTWSYIVLKLLIFESAELSAQHHMQRKRLTISDTSVIMFIQQHIIYVQRLHFNTSDSDGLS